MYPEQPPAEKPLDLGASPPSGKSPAFQFYPADYLADAKVRAMDYEQQGIYITLLATCWLEGGTLPADRAKLAKLLKIPARKFARVWPGVEVCFERQGETYRHPRLDRERAKQLRFSEKQAANGRLGGRPRKVAASSAESHGFSLAKPTESSSSSSSSSSPPYPLHLVNGGGREEWVAPVRELFRQRSRSCTLAEAAVTAAEELRSRGVTSERLARAAGAMLAERTLEHAGLSHLITTFARWDTDARDRAAERWELYKREGLTLMSNADGWLEARIAKLVADGAYPSPDAAHEELRRVRPWDIARRGGTREEVLAEVAKRLEAA